MGGVCDHRSFSHGVPESGILQRDCVDNGERVEKFAVHDNVTDTTVRTFEDEDNANWLCRGMNINAGPGGRYSVKPIKG